MEIIKEFVEEEKNNTNVRVDDYDIFKVVPCENHS
jgi:hypothetical protein